MSKLDSGRPGAAGFGVPRLERLDEEPFEETFGAVKSYLNPNVSSGCFKRGPQSRLNISGFSSTPFKTPSIDEVNNGSIVTLYF